MKLHWIDYPLQTTKNKEGKDVQRSWSALFDEHGTMWGYVRNTDEDDWEAYAGRPGKLFDVFGTEEEAKEEVANVVSGAFKEE